MANLFQEELVKYKNVIDNMIEGGFCKNFFDKYNCGEFMSDYFDVFINYSKGGKRIRPYLVKLGYELITNKENKDIYLPSLSYEIFQTGILAQDDIIDKSTVRRFMPSMYVHLGNNDEGIAKTICMGDLGIIISNDIVANSNFSEDLVLKALESQNKNLLLTVTGEMKDIILSNCTEYTEKDIIEMYSLKTASYTIVGPMLLGAILAGADTKIIKQIKDFGINLGIAFQIKDDILGIFGDEKTVGKSVLSDAREGKKTILTYHFKNNASKEDKEIFDMYYGNENLDIDGLLKIHDIFKSTGSLNYAENKCREYTESVRQIIKDMNISERNIHILLDFIKYLVEREK